MKRPVIGLNCKLTPEKSGDTYWKLDRCYPDAVAKAGGQPLVLPFVATPEEARAWLDRVDAVLFTGGPDIDPKRWGEEKHPNAELLLPEKDLSDFLYATEALARNAPVLGICLGSQLLNVALGGSLHQHIGDDHRNATHAVRIEASRLRDILGAAEPSVNSYHHQAVARVGAGLRVTARAPDDVVEALESEKHRFVIGVQWHPERIADRPEQLALFRVLVDQAR